MMGTSRKYTLSNHLSKFLDVYKKEKGKAKFGKDFEYDPDIHYFSDESKFLIDAFIDLGTYYNNDELKKFLYRIRNCSFIYETYKIEKIEDKFPIKTNLNKEGEKYILNFDLNNLETIIEEDYEYILYNGKMYHLNSKNQELLLSIKNSNYDKIEIKDDELDLFKRGLYKVIKNDIEVDDSVEGLVLPKTISTELYFDLRSKSILVDIKFLYDNEKISYFDKKSNILRDDEYEVKVINDILKYGFRIDGNKIKLDDIELQVEFMENGLEKLACDYVIYTTEKFKGVSIKKKTNVSSMFGIGQDNILSYSFDLGDIKSDELVNIFKEIKDKKKYYRLKNGDILNLEDESLNKLQQLSDELELSDEEIISGKGEVLKYRAIYLDSLKNSKYDIIKTDNLFDNFIKTFYEYKDSDLTLSKKELKTLRDYQLVGVKWLYNLYLTGFGGILADEMGLGKTIQVIYYIKQILKDDKNSKVLIVVPTSLAYNWDHEFNTFGSDIKHVICVGPKEKRKKIINDIKSYQVIVTTYGLLREDEDLYKDLYFHTMVIDEAQNIKNVHAGITRTVKNIKANVKFALTGTPLENSVLELWSIFDFIMPGYLSHLSKFQSKYKIKDYDEEGNKLIEGLSRQINPFILRRKKKDVVKDLPDKLINDIYIDLSDNQKKIYAAELEKVKNKIDEVMKNEGVNQAKFLILPLITKLRQICIDPSIVYEDYNETSNKIEALMNIIDEYTKNNHKILIFSSFKTALDMLEKKLLENKIQSYFINGSVSSEKRVKLVDKFNDNDDIKVFLIMLKSGGTGLNLTSADVVIHLDLWWNPQAENQATDRTHRIGQTKNVEVIHLIAKGTIEEKILELQNKKRLLSDKLIDGEIRDKNIISTLTEEDIKNLLSYENKD